MLCNLLRGWKHTNWHFLSVYWKLSSIVAQKRTLCLWHTLHGQKYVDTRIYLCDWVIAGHVILKPWALGGVYRKSSSFRLSVIFWNLVAGIWFLPATRALVRLAIDVSWQGMTHSCFAIFPFFCAQTWHWHAENTKWFTIFETGTKLHPPDLSKIMPLWWQWCKVTVPPNRLFFFLNISHGLI